MKRPQFSVKFPDGRFFEFKNEKEAILNLYDLSEQLSQLKGYNSPEYEKKAYSVVFFGKDYNLASILEKKPEIDCIDAESEEYTDCISYFP